MGVAALVSLYIAVSWWVAVLALLLARLFAGPGLGLAPQVHGRLSADGWEGGWAFEQEDVRRALVLQHVWHGPGWTTLGFHMPSVGESLQLTVWRNDVSSTGWRRLRQLAARGCNNPRSRISEAQ